MPDVERGDSRAYGEKQYNADEANGADEQEALLSGKSSVKSFLMSGASSPTGSTSTFKLLLAFVAGVAACIATQYAAPWLRFTSPHVLPPSTGHVINVGYAGSQVVSFKLFFVPLLICSNKVLPM